MFGHVRSPPGKGKKDPARALFHVEVLDLLRLGQVGAALLLRHRWSDHVAHLSYRPVVGVEVRTDTCGTKSQVSSVDVWSV